MLWNESDVEENAIGLIRFDAQLFRRNKNGNEEKVNTKRDCARRRGTRAATKFGRTRRWAEERQNVLLWHSAPEMAGASISKVSGLTAIDHPSYSERRRGHVLGNRTAAATREMVDCLRASGGIAACAVGGRDERSIDSREAHSIEMC